MVTDLYALYNGTADPTPPKPKDRAKAFLRGTLKVATVGGLCIGGLAGIVFFAGGIQSIADRLEAERQEAGAFSILLGRNEVQAVQQGRVGLTIPFRTQNYAGWVTVKEPVSACTHLQTTISSNRQVDTFDSYWVRLAEWTQVQQTACGPAKAPAAAAVTPPPPKP